MAVLKIRCSVVNNRDTLSAELVSPKFLPTYRLVFTLVFSICIEGNTYISCISHLFSSHRLVIIWCRLFNMLALFKFETWVTVILRHVFDLVSYTWREESIIMWCHISSSTSPSHRYLLSHIITRNIHTFHTCNVL